MFLLYNILITLFAPIWAPWMWFRTRSRKEQPNWKERFGEYEISPRKDRRRIWIHAVSVGEVVAVMPILQQLRLELPEHEIVLTVTTSSGHQTAREKAAGLYDHLFYFPIDVARFQLSAMQRVQPSVVVVMETELWMNFLWAAKVFDARTLLMNGRISDRSFRRSSKIAFFYRALLSQMDRCLMQSEKDAERIRALGAADAEVLGNCKFDQALGGLDADPDEWRGKLGLRADLPVVVVGSTRGETEERFVFDALQQVGTETFQCVYAPRHIERIPALQDEARRRFGAAALRSQIAVGSAAEPNRFVLLDTYGELDKVYSVADIVVIGGGFDNMGGQNLVQPLAHGKPVLHGPHMQNFREVAAMSTDAGASEICATPEALASAIRDLLGDEPRRRTMGAAAQRLVNSNSGASARYAKVIGEEARNFKVQLSRGKSAR